LNGSIEDIINETDFIECMMYVYCGVCFHIPCVQSCMLLHCFSFFANTGYIYVVSEPNKNHLILLLTCTLNWLIGTHNLVDGILMKEQNGTSSLFDAARSNPFLSLVSYGIKPW